MQVKQVLINVEEKKYGFFMELVSNFKFITVADQAIARKEQLKEIAEGMQAAQLAGKSKIKTRSAKDFVNGL